MYLVKYKATLLVSQIYYHTNNTFQYFADSEDALNSGRVCEKIVVWEDIVRFPESRYDINGKSFREAVDQEIDMFAT